MATEPLLFDPEGCNAQGARMYWCSFVPNNTGTPTGLTGFGVTSVAYVATGVFKIQFDDANWIALIGGWGTVQAAASGAGDGFVMQIDQASTSLANGTVAFALLDKSQNRAALAGDANCRVYCYVVVSKAYNDTGGP